MTEERLTRRRLAHPIEWKPEASQPVDRERGFCFGEWLIHPVLVGLRRRWLVVRNGTVVQRRCGTKVGPLRVKTLALAKLWVRKQLHRERQVTT